MDVASSTIGLIKLVIDAVEYGKDVHHAKQQMEQEKAKLTSLRTSLELLDNNSLNASDRLALGSLIKQLDPYLKDLYTELTPSSDRFMVRISLKLLWPSKKDSVRKLFEKIDSLIAQIILCLERTNLEKTIANDINALKAEVFASLKPSIADRLRLKPERAREDITPETGNWIFSEESIKDWGRNEHGMLWIAGVQGSGKTALMTIVGDDLQSQVGEAHKQLGLTHLYVSRVYCDHSIKPDDHFDIIMGLWAHLALSINFELDPQRIEEIRKTMNVGTEEARKSEKLKVFVDTMKQAGKVVLIVDGLDEVPQKFQQPLVKALRYLQQAHEDCRILISSRPYAEIRGFFEDCPRFILEAREGDIQLYIEDRISRENREFFKQEDLKAYITNRVVENSKGVFLMAKYSMDGVLKAQTRYEIDAVLERLPANLSDAYTKGLERLAEDFHHSHNDLPCLAIQALFWVAFAKIPLTEKQLKQALAFDEGDTQYDERKELQDRAIDVLCGDLLTVDPNSGEVHVYHKTITDHILEEKTQKLWFPKVDFRQHMHVILVEFLLITCVTGDGESGHCFGDKYPLAIYALQNWGLGLGEILTRGTPLYDVVEKFLRTPFHRCNSYFRSNSIAWMKSKARSWGEYTEWTLPDGSLSPGELSSLHWAVSFDLRGLVPSLVDYETRNPVQQPVSMSPLGLAAAIGHTDIARKLLEAGIQPEVWAEECSSRPPLYDASYFNNAEATLLLLEHGADPCWRSRDFDQSPIDISYSLWNRNIAITMATFIANKPLVRPQELQLLIKGSFIIELKQAIYNGLDVNQYCEYGKKALDYANELGNEDVIKVLIDAGATPALMWPAFQQRDRLFSQNIPEHWGDCDITEEISFPYYVEARCNDHEGLPVLSSHPILDIVIDEKRVKLPIQRIIFESISRDQGWSDYGRSHETYLENERSWIGVCATTHQGTSHTLEIQRNVHASESVRLHTNVWDLEELSTSFPAKAEFLKGLKYGDTLQISANAHGGRGWCCCVASMRVRINGIKACVKTTVGLEE